MPHVVDWLPSADVDVLALQETKTKDEDFPADAFEAIGYHTVFRGQAKYNGVALISRHPPTDIEHELPKIDSADKRVLAASYGDVRVINFYIVNGQNMGTEKYDYKMRWLKQATAFIKDQLTRYPKLVVVGDFNIIPEDKDAKKPAEWHNTILGTPKERAALQDMLALGLQDAFRLHDQPDEEFSWWPYWRQAFETNNGARIDLILASEQMAQTCSMCTIDKEPRGLERPSDHTPVVAQFAP